ncbi:MAG: glycosyl transferase family 2, partial [Lentisphaeraceae bacterium]|nr:glycosyl transferase family 2 [Lentisphaeraceae bacterium]
LKASLQKLDSGHVCGGGSRIAFQDGETQLDTRIWSCISKITNLAAGAYIFCLNDAFKDTGGYDQKVYDSEDIIFSRALKKRGRKNGHKKFTILTDFPAITSNRKLEWYSTWHIITMLLLIAIMPWRLRNREKMYFWYSRPQNPLKKHKYK